MKKSLIALAAIFAIGAAQAEYIGSGASNSNGVVSSSGAYAQSAGNGLSISAAGNSQTASSTMTAGATKGTVGSYQYGTAGVSGAALTTTASFAGNLSIGNATGSAGAGGASVVNASSNAYFDKHGKNPEGTTSGSLSSVAQSGVVAGKNGAGVAGGANTADYVGYTASTKFGNTDYKLFNTATTGAAATSGSLSGATHIGNATSMVNVNGAALVNSYAASGNVISNSN